MNDHSSSGTFEEHEKRIEDAEKHLHAHKEEAARLRAEFDHLMDFAGGGIQSDIYSQQASSAKVSKWMWQIITVVLLFFILIFGFSFGMDVTEEGFISSVIISYLPTLGVPVLIAIFTTRQSNNARRDEKESRDTLAELAIPKESTRNE